MTMFAGEDPEEWGFTGYNPSQQVGTGTPVSKPLPLPPGVNEDDLDEDVRVLRRVETELARREAVRNRNRNPSPTIIGNRDYKPPPPKVVKTKVDKLRERVRRYNPPVNTGTNQEVTISPATLTPEITEVTDVQPVVTAAVEESGMVVSPDGIVYQGGQPVPVPSVSSFGYGEQPVEIASTSFGFDQLLTLIIQLFVEIFGFSPQAA